MKISILASIIVCGLVVNVTAITKNRGTRRGEVERLLKKSRKVDDSSKSSKSKKSSSKGKDFFFLALPCATGSKSNFGEKDGFSFTQELSCLTYTAGQGFDSEITEEIEYDASIGARCCGSSAAGTQQWRFKEVNSFYSLIQNKGSGLCLRAPTDCSQGFPDKANKSVFNGVYPGAGECDEDNDLYLWSVEDMTLTSKACSAEGSPFRDISLFGCTDGIVTIPGPSKSKGPVGGYYGAAEFVASKSVKSFSSNECVTTLCSMDFEDNWGPGVENCPSNADADEEEPPFDSP